MRYFVNILSVEKEKDFTFYREENQKGTVSIDFVKH